ncbi:MAG: transcription antitermination factor NusB [Chlamydiae bacterium]|nr:transcription antitermination factor NusB [Chlamydiota bacterium]
MSIPKQKLREAVFYILFAKDFQESAAQDTTAMLMEVLEMSRSNVKLAWEKAESIFLKKEEIDTLLREYITEYTLERVSSVERNVLRLSAYELLFDQEVHEVVAISEGVRLSRKFGSPEGALFVNGVLDALYKHQKAVAVTQ